MQKATILSKKDKASLISIQHSVFSNPHIKA